MIKTEKFSERCCFYFYVGNKSMCSFQLSVVWVQCKRFSMPFGNSLYAKAAVSLPFFDEAGSLNGIPLIIDWIDSSRLVQYLPALPSSRRSTHKHYSADIPSTPDAAGARRPVAIWYDAGTLKRIRHAPLAIVVVKLRFLCSHRHA